MYLLDTNIISETRKPRPHGGVLAWIRTVPPEQLFLSAVTMGELQRGLESLYKKDVGKAQEIHQWVNRLAAIYEVIPADGAIFRKWATITRDKPKHPWEDALIAATACERRLIVATRNTKDFEGFTTDSDVFTLQTYNPFHYDTRDKA
ncbi:type II toxin-antitoxin system VapC family toxin [Acidicapsa ligni]|uniref:type II toxin-antitoxin system VapC family toxin n=1 Tax=Acidicapsa ligni TaxID=542300 RepID=UPI0021DFEE2A|nr:type II toxin-antitoxin system VapC family toxin [Acidicapsa ligni]